MDDRNKLYILKRINKETNSDCWLWVGPINKTTGYGTACCRINGIQKTRLVHRFSYEVFKGLIPDGLVVDHLCKIKTCVNPDHLEAVTQKENLRRAGWGLNKDKERCPRGHPYDKTDGNHRYCSICKSATNSKMFHSQLITKYEAIENRKKYQKVNPLATLDVEKIETIFGIDTIEAAIKQLLLLDGIDCYSNRIINARKFLSKNYSKEQIMEFGMYLGLSHRTTRLRKSIIT